MLPYRLTDASVAIQEHEAEGWGNPLGPQHDGRQDNSKNLKETQVWMGFSIYYAYHVLLMQMIVVQVVENTLREEKKW